MSNTKSGSLPKAGQGGFPSMAHNNQSLLLEKLNVRRSTPDSEALASSDDEPEHRQDAVHSSVQHQKPVRRASWLNDTSQANISPVRKSSFASSTMSPAASHPSTPSAETSVSTWGSHSAHTAAMGRPHQQPSTFAWGTGIWNTERSKDPPSRLTEVLQSPTSTAPPGLVPGGSFGGESSYSQTSPGPREVGPNSQIPFAIPLHPTPKTYRSQSYSVGQLEPDAPNAALPGPSHLPGRGRQIGPAGLQHRPSRPSMLSEMSSENMLGKVHEVEDDDNQSSHSSGQGTQIHQADQSKTIELLARENAMLRQQQQYQNSRLRPRASTSYGIGNGYSVRDPVPEESDYAVDELDESGEGHDAAAKRALGRRMSELGAGAFSARSPLYPVENRKLENVKKAYWQSSLGFGGLGDIPQSRRHSFADVPTRQGSISSVAGAEGATLQEINSPDTIYPQDFGGFAEHPGFGATSPMSYFTGGGNISNAQQAIASSAYVNPYASYGIPPALANRPPSPHRNMYGMGQPRHNQLLHIVLFKCSRADVFYIQEGTGLTVRPGDLVIVEADRGTDLGTVDRSNVDWQTAKELKEHYAEEHYKWLMMYSQNAAAAQEGNGAGLMAAANGMQGGAIGGMGPPSQHHMPEPGAGELKPKLIKRLAQSHEIHNLREKEGNEAKAKRVCMQKVKEHGLNMEILDAEFQMDWKKLTFYYFADAYINFNSLVTDLFKIYKTRIWMSAINPASFASPTLGLQAPSGIGPGAVGIGRGSNNAAGSAERRQNQPQETQPSFPGGSSGRSFQSPIGQAYGTDRPVVSGNTYPSMGFPMSGYGAFGLNSRAGASPYVTGMMPGADAYSGGFSQGSEFQALRARYPNPHDASASQDSTIPAAAGQNDWAGAFQSLSLNSR